MSINIWTDSMQHAALLGKPVLFTNWLIQRDIIPDGWYCYDLRGTHKSPSTRTTLVDHAADYHAGTVLSPIPLKHEGTASRRVNGTFYLLGEEMTLEQFCEEHDLAYPQDTTTTRPTFVPCWRRAACSPRAAWRWPPPRCGA